MNTLRIDDLAFEVSSAELTGFVESGRLMWGIDIRTNDMRIEAEGEHWQPRAYSERLFAIDGLVLEHWQQAFEKDVRWDDCYDAKIEDTHASLYVVEHNDIYKSRLSITPGKGRDIRVDWNGLCDVFWSERYGKGLDFAVNAEGIFRGIAVGSLGEAMTEEEAENRIRPCLSKDDFIWQPASSRHYYPMMIPAD